MSLLFPKNPKDMNTQELFDMMQLVQKQAKNQNRYYPMYTSRQPAPGAQATAEHMHEDATRKQLTSLYEAQNKKPNSKQSRPEEQLAQAGFGITSSVTKGVKQGFKGAPDALISGVGIGLLDQAETKFQIKQLADTGMTESQFIIQNNPNAAALEIFRQRVKELNPGK